MECDHGNHSLQSLHEDHRRQSLKAIIEISLCKHCMGIIEGSHGKRS